MDVIVPEDFDIRIVIKNSESEDVIITENGLDLKFDITVALTHCPPDPTARWHWVAAYLTKRWAEQLQDKVIHKQTALEVWKLITDKSNELKKNSNSEEKSSQPTPE